MLISVFVYSHFTSLHLSCSLSRISTKRKYKSSSKLSKSSHEFPNSNRRWRPASLGCPCSACFWRYCSKVSVTGPLSEGVCNLNNCPGSTKKGSLSSASAGRRRDKESAQYILRPCRCLMRIPANCANFQCHLEYKSDKSLDVKIRAKALLSVWTSNSLPMRKWRNELKAYNKAKHSLSCAAHFCCGFAKALLLNSIGCKKPSSSS